MPHDISLQLAEEDFSDIKKVGERADVLWHIELQNSAGITCNCFKVDRPTSKKSPSSQLSVECLVSSSVKFVDVNMSTT